MCRNRSNSHLVSCLPWEKGKILSAQKNLQREQRANLECGLIAYGSSLKKTGQISFKTFTVLKTLMLASIIHLKVAFKTSTTMIQLKLKGQTGKITIEQIS